MREIAATSRDVIVIGAGISGLAAAWRRKQGGAGGCGLEWEHAESRELAQTPEEKRETLESGAPYYWRIRAIDKASNVGDWSTVQEFYVSIFASPMPPWILYSLLAEGGVFICFFGYWFIKKRT